jgi:hypothetical protein
MSKEFNKLYDSEYFQIYKSNKKSKYPYEYYYRLIKFTGYKLLIEDDVHEYKSDEFPFKLFTCSVGFLFVHGKNTNIPILPISNYKSYKTESMDLSNDFINTNFNVIMNIKPGFLCNPKCTNSYTTGFNLTAKTKSSKDLILNEFKKIQTIKNINDWVEFIKTKCPYDVHFQELINENSFKKQITEKDYEIKYDIKDIDEINIIKNIEDTFEDMNQIVKIYDNYENIVDRIKQACDDKKIKYKSSFTKAKKHIKYSKPKDELKWIELKYSDLLKCGLEYTLLDFIS